MSARRPRCGRSLKLWKEDKGEPVAAWNAPAIQHGRYWAFGFGSGCRLAYAKFAVETDRRAGDDGRRRRAGEELHRLALCVLMSGTRFACRVCGWRFGIGAMRWSAGCPARQRSTGPDVCKSCLGVARVKGMQHSALIKRVSIVQVQRTARSVLPTVVALSSLSDRLLDGNTILHT